MDITRAIISSFYISTRGVAIGLHNSCLGLEGGKIWERVFTRHSPEICKTILKVVDETIAEGQKEEINSLIKEKLEEKNI